MSLPSVKYYGEGNLPAVNMIEGSIGYSVGAVLGAALAARELPDGAERRVILFVGEGSLQLTVQEISTIIRSGLKPILYSPSLLYRF
jgi:pyruvate decarboxylase